MTIKELRNITKLNKKEFAKKYNIPYNTLTTWEADESAKRHRNCPSYFLSALEKLILDEYNVEKIPFLSEFDGTIYGTKVSDNNGPYISYKHNEIFKVYNKSFGDERMCICGHSYYRHFDTYENMAACGCKYCSCNNFIEDTKNLSTVESVKKQYFKECEKGELYELPIYDFLFQTLLNGTVLTDKELEELFLWRYEEPRIKELRDALK